MTWYLPGVIWELVVVWRRDWESLPSTARRVWWVALGWGLLATEMLTIALVVLTRSLDGSGWLEDEAAALAAIEASEIISFNDAVWLDVFGNGFVLVAMIAVAAGIATFRRRPLVAIALAFGYLSLFIPVLTGWLTWGRMRPSVIADGMGSPGGSISSFPSGHLVQAIVAFGILFFLWLRNGRSIGEQSLTIVLFLLLICTVAFTRLRLGAHWPSDMVAAAIIGLFWLSMVLRALRAAEHVVGEDAPRPIETGTESGPSTGVELRTPTHRP